MNDLKMKEITIGTKLKHIKAFIRELVNEGKILNFNISFIKIVKEASEDKIALEDEDIQKLKDYKPDSNKKDQVRDLFLFQIFTLQRMSDLFALNKNQLDLNNNLIRIKQIKTGKEVNLPLLDIHLEILRKYNFILPKIAESKYNLLIKEVCKEAGLTEEIMIYQKDGKKTILSKFKKYEKVSSHTARRTGITLCIRKKMPIEEVMKLSGHTSMQSLEQYIKISQNEAISTAKQIFNKPKEV
jgi:integrase